jgi:hypothetical protein
LAALTNGRSLADDAGAVFAHNLQATATFTPLAPLLLLLAALLLPLDIAVRRLLITSGDLARLRSLVMRPRTAAETSERMSTLLGVKARAQQQIEQESGVPSATIAALRSRRAAARESQTGTPIDTQPPADDQEMPQPRQPTLTTTTKPGDSNLASKLLDRKRDRE